MLMVALPLPLPPLSLFVVGGVLRAALIAWSVIQDHRMEVPYTDVDYHVFTDAAAHVARGESPYQRHTYRYTPFIALLAVPNLLVPWFGKAVFAACDLAIGWLIYKALIPSSRRGTVWKGAEQGTLRGQCQGPQSKGFWSICLSLMTGIDSRIVAVALWLFNPITLVVSTRGNAESAVLLPIVASLAFASLATREARRGRRYGAMQPWKLWLAVGALLGLATHLKMYPVIYSLPLYFSASSCTSHYPAGSRQRSEDIRLPRRRVSALLQRGPAPASSLFSSKRNEGGVVSTIMRLFSPTPSRMSLVVGFIASFGALFALAYSLYGEEFVHHTYLYHVTRTDIRHNFSVYFYPMYLAANPSTFIGGGLGSVVGSLLGFIPQAAVQLSTALLFYNDLGACFFVQTVAFVAFNKVFTSQYFLWFLVFLPFVHKRLLARDRIWRLAAWFLAQGVWLGVAYKIEFLGEPHFLLLFLSCILLFASHLLLITAIHPCGDA